MKQVPKTMAGLLTLLLALMVSVAMARTTIPQNDQSGQDQSSGQATQDQSQAGTTEHHAKAHHVTVTGCLEKTPDGSAFQITSDKTQKTYQLNPASGMDLSAHVGHTVQITGTHAEAAAGQPAGQAGTEQLNVTKMKHVKDTCAQKPTK